VFYWVIRNNKNLNCYQQKEVSFVYYLAMIGLIIMQTWILINNLIVLGG
jgi:hypothetical protein